jgi:hypothetical protein
MDIFYEKTLNRIIQGRLRLPSSDPVLYLYEPDNSIIEESYDIYEETYKDAYFKGVYIKEELKEVLFFNGLWTPEDDKNAKDTEEKIEEVKVSAFESVKDPKKLRGIKTNLRFLEKEYIKHKSKFHALDHISCEGVAGLARSVWIVSQTIKDRDGKRSDLKNQPLTKILEYYNSKSITPESFRLIARSEPFRTMWAISKKQSNLFNRASCDFTKDQLALCQFSSMYDNVYESHEPPGEDVIEDDDCLDGWFITRRREHEKEKNKREVESMIGNSKIANSQEVYIMAKDGEMATKINDMNSIHAKNIINSRNEQIKKQGTVGHSNLVDVRQDIAMQARQQAINTIKG